MLDRLDQWLLTRFDLFVGWNRDRGAGDQWQLARAAGDASLALNAAGMILLVQGGGGGDALDMAARILLLVAVGWSTIVGRRSVTRYERARDGALRARIVERPLRRILIVLTAAMLVSFLDHPAIDDVAVALSLMLLDASVYLKAATPPPPADRTEAKPKLAST